MALGYWAVSKGLVSTPKGGPVDVVIDAPSGRVVATVTIKDDKSIHADIVNVLTYQMAIGLCVAIPSRDADVHVDLAFGGAVFASVNAARLGLEVKPENANEFIRLQREIKASLGDRAKYDSNELYAMLFFEEQEQNPEEPGLIIQKSVNVYGDGQIDRSHCGSGACGRIENSRFLHQSIIESTFEARLVSKGQSPT
ncbi:Proline racemase [Fusarium austroafricanum]|uniref:trans-L-3-hydroxyproline dehydratase n=1 Tax=Fusarium austroafricanum TaxID=2364996 RepID=A0A8H4JCX9_9HYPO|nr:Proline racemase [Fusarium austroafricanum]